MWAWFFMADKQKYNLSPIKIGLLTPYTGGNLGDGAIQEAVIANIKSRYPNAQLHGFTITPEKTEKHLRIPCSPITALSIKHYCTPAPSINNSDICLESNNLGSTQVVKKWIKRYTLLFNFLKRMKTWTNSLIFPLRIIFAFILSLLAEILLIRNSYWKLKDFDYLIVSGGGQLDDYWGGAWGHPYSLLKWGLIARVTKTRFLFLSVGTCRLTSHLSSFFVKQALSLAEYRSYRDETSKRILEHIAFTRDDVVYPDLAFSHEIPCPKHPRNNINNKPVVGVSPIAYLSSYYWPDCDQPVYASYIHSLVSFVSSLLCNQMSVVLFHTSGTDKYVVKEMIDTLSRDSRLNIGNIKVVHTETVEELLSVMEELDFVVASRLHGVILAHFMHKPVLAISYDKKVDIHMSDIGQSDYCMNIQDIKADLLIDKFYKLMSYKDKNGSEIAYKIGQFRDKLNIQYDKILEIAE